MKKILTYTLPLIFLLSCGGGNSEPDRVMSKGELYTVSSGSKVIKNSDTAILKITHYDGKNESTIQLLEGEATIQY